MRLRLRLFLLLAGLVAGLVACQALLVRSLADRLARDVHAVAFSVGEEILSGFTFHTRDAQGGERFESEIVALTVSPDATAGGPEAAPRWKMKRELRSLSFGPQPGGEGAAGGGGETEASAAGVPLQRFSLEPGEERGVLFLKGPLPERRIPIRDAAVVSTVDRFGNQLLLGSLAILGFGLVGAALLAHRSTRPLAALAQATRRLGEGELGVELAVERRDEIGELVASFNRMSARLAALDRENRRLAESERLSELGEVARGLAHALRNPLNALGLAVERLAAPSAPGDAEELAERCRRQIRRLDGSLRGFLALASAAAARAAPVELGSLAREVALEALQDAAGRVRVEVEAAERIELAAVEAELKAMLQALVVNACEASPEGGRVVVRVAALERSDGRAARFEVDDEGPGVAPEIAPRLFAPHVTSKPQGSGMGLFLAQRMAHTRYGGAVALAPLPGGGTRATLVVAARQAEAA